MPKKATKARTIPPKSVTIGQLAGVLLTPAQLRCLLAWHRLFQAEGREPTVRELSKELGLVDNGAAMLVKELDKKGAFARPPVQVPGPRVLTETGKKWLAMAT